MLVWPRVTFPVNLAPLVPAPAAGVIPIKQVLILTNFVMY